MTRTPFRKRDQACIDFVIRNKMATNQVIAAQIMPGRSINAVAKVTARLCRTAVLSRHMLIPPETYFRLGQRAIGYLGLSGRLAEPLGPQALPTDYATMIYTTTGNKRRRRLTPSEVDQYMPWLPDEFKHAPYAIDANGTLDLIRVDLGGAAQHVAKKVTVAAEQRLRVPEIASLADQSRFRISLLTTCKEKAAAIARSLDNLGCTDPIRVHLAVISKLSLLLLRSN